MDNQREVNIELIKGTLDDYIVKDKDKIVIGRFTITELDKENKKCNLKLKFYREDNYDLLKITLEAILKAVFKDKNIFKANVVVSENINLKPFLDIGFTLEAIFTDNIFTKGSFYDELSFGINRNEYLNSGRNNIVEMKGKNILIRNFTPDDAQDLLEYYLRNKDHLKEFEPVRDASFFTYEMQKEILLESYRQLMTGVGSDLGIYKDNKLIGKAKISNIVYGVLKSGILGYSIDKEYEGKGYMKEAINLVLEYAKEYLDLHRIEASVLTTNERSKGVLLSCGFEEVGINKKYLYINGKWSDHITFYKIL
ncbi:MAG: GNAT family protein [Clostridium celatum]|uniref:GNAT family N-acetyltransferase n=1 Tax=uncultured Clostridium sp. TaxID=59620 RepID=UPI0025F60957|nr:GNAT family protein [uncultured Clostridium sp.]MDU4883713.1 GNAT family protein [Clostridium celatum]MDU5263027.1 GNAT family protein [Clostridium celatum]MDU7076606.1 GNAT family protein [Clostridium celatum]